MLIFLDLETTGVEAKDVICSIGVVAVDGDEVRCHYELVNEGKKIPALASSINHITNEMIKGKPKFTETEVFAFLEKYNAPEHTLIAHNARFDLEKLLACGLAWHGEVVDTLRVSKHLLPECEMFSLQFLRYDLRLYKNEESLLLACSELKGQCAHNALFDAMNVKLLYDCLLEIAPHAKIAELSFENVLVSKFEFGKYSGRYIEEIAMIDRGYLMWMLENIMDLDEDLRYSINYHLEG